MFSSVNLGSKFSLSFRVSYARSEVPKCVSILLKKKRVNLLLFNTSVSKLTVHRLSTSPRGNLSFLSDLTSWIVRNAPRLFSALRGIPGAFPFLKNVQNPPRNAKATTKTKYPEWKYINKFKKKNIYCSCRQL